jgi:3-oxoacyl-[acyl-carrier-protein] synthase-3
MNRIGKRKIKIVGSGFYVPDKVLTNADLEKMVDTSDEWITTRSGIKERRIAPPEMATSDMGIAAAKRALADAGRSVGDIDLIIVATATPDTAFPSTACWVQKGLGADNVPAWDIGGACSGFLYGMIVAESLILCGQHKTVLLIAGENLSKVTNWEDRGTCVLFGDGSAAVVLEESDDDSGMLAHYWKADGNLGYLLLQPGGGSRMPVSEEVLKEKAATLQMRGNEVFKHAVKRMGEAAEEVIKLSGLSKEDVDWLIPHQANIRIIKATGNRLGLPEEKVFVNIHKYGNVSCVTIPTGLCEMKEKGLAKKGDNIVMVAFGAGFTWAGIAYRW